MLRRFNYTNRKRIAREDVSVVLRKIDSEVSFDADLSLLTTYGFEKKCRVFVEAYRQTIWTRYDFGIVGAIQPPGDCSLARFGTPEGIHFRIKVTDPSSYHRLVAEADGLQLREADSRSVPTESLLRIISAPIESAIFRLTYDDDGPVLEISKDAGEKTEIAKDPAFSALVYPSVLKEILTRILLVDKHDDVDNLDLWQSQWLRFAMGLHGVGAVPEVTDQDDVEDWIADAISSFAKQTHVPQKFAKYREGQE